MKCSECNKVLKPVVAIDIDGTIGCYHQHFLDFAVAYLGRDPHSYNYNGNGGFKQWFCMQFNVSQDIWHDIKLAYRQGGMKRSMPIYEGAAALTARVRERAELWLTTTRPYIRHDNVDPDTREWLRRHGIQYDYLIYDGAKYKKLYDLVGEGRVCAVLDDLVDEIANAEFEFGTDVPILRKNIYNSLTSYRSEAGNLSEALIIIMDRIKRWEGKYEYTG